LLPLQITIRRKYIASAFSLGKRRIGKQKSRSELFLGRLIDSEKEITHENISYNADFLVVLHQIVRDLMVNDPDVIAEAKKQPNGFVFVVDRRAPEMKKWKRRYHWDLFGERK